MTLTQHELDTLVAQRFEWAARFASAVSHEVGNIVLFGEAAEPGATMSDEVRAYREQYAYLIQHFRQLLRALGTWKTDTPREQMASMTGWWRAQGGFLRQFVRRTAPVTLTSTVAENRVVEIASLSRMIAAILLAIEVQSPKLERVMLEAAPSREGDGRVCLMIKVLPLLDPNAFLIPTFVSQQAERHGNVLVTRSGEEALLLIELHAALQDAAQGAAGAETPLF